MAKSTSTRNSNTWDTGTCKRPEQEATPPSERVGPRGRARKRLGWVGAALRHFVSVTVAAALVAVILLPQPGEEPIAVRPPVNGGTTLL